MMHHFLKDFPSPSHLRLKNMWDNIRQGVYAPRYEVIACREKDSSGRWIVVSDALIFLMNVPMKNIWDGTERRKPDSCRRVSDRRTNHERRCDRRNTAEKKSRDLVGWLRSFACLIDRLKSGIHRYHSRCLPSRHPPLVFAFPAKKCIREPCLRCRRSRPCGFAHKFFPDIP
jgi:hypothetical protein